MAKELRNLLVRARQLKGMSLRDVENRTGVSNPYISQLEKGHIAEPSPKKLFELAKCYGLEYGALLEAAGYAVPSQTAVSHGDGVMFMGDELSDDEVAAVTAFLRAYRESSGKSKRK